MTRRLVATLFLMSMSLYPILPARAISPVDCDFDGDAKADLPVGVPAARVELEDGVIKWAAGAVVVFPGTSSGPSTANATIWSQDSPGVIGSPGSNENLGRSVACGDFNEDGYEDLAIGAGNVGWSGTVNVLFGSATGLTAEGDVLISWTSLALGVSGEDLSEVMASGDFNGDEASDLAFSGTVINGPDAIPVVITVLGSAAGLDQATASVWTVDTGAVLGTSTDSTNFGRSLASGDLNGDTFADLAIGSDGVISGGAAGAVHVLYGNVTGLADEDNQRWTQDSTGIVGLSEVGDEFGESLAAGDFDGDGIDDLVVGAPGENSDRGLVHVLHGSLTGLTAAGSQMWWQATPGIPGVNEGDQRFAHSLAVGDLDGDGYADVAIGVPRDGGQQVGAINVLYGTVGGITATGAALFNQDTPGVKGTAGYNEGFGASVAALDMSGDGRSDVAIAVPGDLAVAFLPGSDTGLSTLGDKLFEALEPIYGSLTVGPGWSSPI